MNTNIFGAYLQALSRFKPEEYKIVVIDNAGFHSTTNMDIPENIHLLNIPAYSPELNPCEQVWQYIKQRFKLKLFPTIEELKDWLHSMCRSMDNNLIKSITSNHHYLTTFNRIFYS